MSFVPSWRTNPNWNLLERFYRDMHLRMMHGRHDIAAQIVGAAELGEDYDTNRNH